MTEHIGNMEKRPGLLAIEWVTLAYTLFTAALVLLLWREFRDPWQLLTGRAFVLGGMALLFGFHCLRPNRYTLFLRNLYPLTLLGYWYPDTYEFCQIFPNLDHVFAAADAALFGCQPSLEMSGWLSGKVWSELFHLGYFSYYPLIALAVLSPLCRGVLHTPAPEREMLAENRSEFERSAFIVLTAFFLYYLIYLFLPVAGPQYYFHAVGEDIINAGHFPQLGDYFRTHTELAASPGPEGFFRSLVESTQQSGERPTAAFPSSHVGMSTVLLFLLWRTGRPLFWCALPFYVFLCGATVYIEAHYLIDVFGGWVSAIIFYLVCSKLWLRAAHLGHRTLSTFSKQVNQ